MKIRVNYSIETDTKEKFDKVCKEKAINKSALVEKLILEYLKEQEAKDSER